MDEEIPAPPKEPWNDDSPVIKYQATMAFPRFEGAAKWISQWMFFVFFPGAKEMKWKSQSSSEVGRCRSVAKLIATRRIGMLHPVERYWP